MRQPKGLIPVVVVSVIAVLAIVMVGVSWYYNQHKDEVHPPFDSPEFYANETENSYLACGCGCCSVDPVEKCLYQSEGDDIEKIKNQDKAARQNPQCALMGCSFPILYKYCDDDAINGNINSAIDSNTSTVDTSDWQTYTNDEFSFNYPASWTIKDENGAWLYDENGDVQMYVQKRLRNTTYDYESNLQKSIESWTPGSFMGTSDSELIDEETIIDNDDMLGYYTTWKITILSNPPITHLRADFESKTKQLLTTNTGTYATVYFITATDDYTDADLFKEIIFTFEIL